MTYRRDILIPFMKANDDWNEFKKEYCLNEGHDVCVCGNCEEIPQDLLTIMENKL